MPRKKKTVKRTSKKEKKIKTVLKTKPASLSFEPLRGMKDILPVDAPYWFYLRNQIEKVAFHFGFSFIETPILELRDLFVRSVGTSTDIVEKEMYEFVDRDGERVCLRPEGTASVARAYINHGMINLPQPVKLFYLGPMFRRDRPQAGRYRQFHQVGFEVLGSNQPVTDAELILAAFTLFESLKIPVTVQVNSLGCENCRKQYKKELINYYRNRRNLLCDNCKKRLLDNPLRLLDCKEPNCELLKENAPQILDFLDEECRAHFFKVLEYLDEANIPYLVNPFIVRGLDYYNGPVYEFFLEVGEEKEASQKKEEKKTAGESGNEEKEEKMGKIALGGGGRYDKLVEILGGRPTPAAGFGLGLERIILALKTLNLSVPQERPDVFIAQLGDAARRKAFVLWKKFFGKVNAQASLAKDSLRQQLELANRLNVQFTIIIGQKEVLDETVILKDMEAGTQEIIPWKKIVDEVERRIRGLRNLGENQK